MTVKLIVAPEAELDLLEAAGWYEERRAGLGERFLTSADACVQGLCRMPERHSPVYENYRRALPVRRFLRVH